MGVGDSGVVLPNVFIGGNTPTGLGMDSVSEDVLDTSESEFSFEDNEDLPMEVSGIVSLFELTLDVGNSWRKIW